MNCLLAEVWSLSCFCWKEVLLAGLTPPWKWTSDTVRKPEPYLSPSGSEFHCRLPGSVGAANPITVSPSPSCSLPRPRMKNLGEVSLPQSVQEHRSKGCMATWAFSPPGSGSFWLEQLWGQDRFEPGDEYKANKSSKKDHPIWPFLKKKDQPIWPFLKKRPKSTKRSTALNIKKIWH